jgi:aryl-alcohol dehydrogenase-like predicted oxidoreductase
LAPHPTRGGTGAAGAGGYDWQVEARTLGRTGIDVGVVGLGAWQLGDRGWNGPDDDEALRIVDEALERGVTLFDTAPPYAQGRSEELLGRALEGRRDRAVLVTKFGYTVDVQPDFSADRLEASVEGSLKRLRTDRLDVVLLHSPPAELMDGGAPHYALLQQLKDAGVIRAYGVSLDWNRDLERVLATTGSEVVEVLLNAFHQDPLPAVRQAAKQGVGVLAKVPLDSGWLSGKYGAGSTFDGVRDRWSDDEIARRGWLVERFEALLPAGTSTPHGALQFLLANPAVTAVIPGAKSVDQLRDNVAAADGALPDETIAQIHELWRDAISVEPVPW